MGGGGRVLVLVGILLVAAMASAGADPMRGPRDTLRGRRVVRPRIGTRSFVFAPRLRVPAPRLPRLLAPPPPDENLPPPVSIPSPLLEDRPQTVPPLSHGFVLTVSVGGTARPAIPTVLSRYRDVGTALAACWSPPLAGWASITMRVAFRRDGTLYGTPRIPFVDARNADTKTALARSLAEAVGACAPLPFSSSLGSAVAGEIFAIRFLNKGAP